MSADRRISLFAGFLALSLLVGGAMRLPVALAEPDKASVHVYPGAVPLNQSGATSPSNAGDSQPAAADKQPSPADEQPSHTDEQPTGTDDQPVQSNDKADKNKETASQQWTAADSEDPEVIDARRQALAGQHYQLASHYIQKWDLDLAEIELDETIANYPNYLIAHRDMCLLALWKLRFDRALAEFMMVTGLGEPTEYSSADKTALDEKAMHAHYKKALNYGRSYTWTEAITELLWAQTYAPGDPAIHHSLGFAYGSAGDFQRAEEEYKLCFEAAPKDGLAHADFADMLADFGKTAEAEAEMKKAVALAPNAAALHVDLGWLAEQRNEIESATSEFQQAIKLSPKHAGLWTHLGRLLERQNKIAEAEDAYKHALGVNSAYDEAQQALNRLEHSPKQDGA
jgi:Flp pilus assembly protein TadD